MPYKWLAIFGDVDVEFECADTEFERFGEGSQRFSGRLAAATGVGLQVEIGRLRGHGRRKSQHDDSHQHRAKAHGPLGSQFD